MYILSKSQPKILKYNWIFWLTFLALVVSLIIHVIWICWVLLLFRFCGSPWDPPLNCIGFLFFLFLLVLFLVLVFFFAFLTLKLWNAHQHLYIWSRTRKKNFFFGNSCTEESIDSSVEDIWWELFSKGVGLFCTLNWQSTSIFIHNVHFFIDNRFISNNKNHRLRKSGVFLL